MKKHFFVLSLMVLLSGCARYEAAQRCQDQAGGIPNRWTYLFGVAGAIANEQTAEKQAYNQSMDACLARYDAAQKAAPSQPTDGASDASPAEHETRDTAKP